jgi:hypothetical protein
MKDRRIFAMHLPQYHECKYNNKWWGNGFTEWTNVYKTKPLFEGHQQPKIPLHGKYNLSQKNEIESQFKLASEYGIDGFIYYSYWYKGKRPLGIPLDIIRDNKELDVKYALCWANHSWTRSWSNRSGALDVLIEQTYPENSIEYNDYFSFLESHFFDDRYIKIDGKPYYMIYSPSSIPKLEEFVENIREYFRKINKIEIFIVAGYTTANARIKNTDIFDAVSLNQPALSFWSPKDVFDTKIHFGKSYFNSSIRNLPLRVKKALYLLRDILPNRITIFDYDKVWSKVIAQYKDALTRDTHKIIPMGFVDFDNTPRYGNRAILINGFTVRKFRKYMKELLLMADGESDIVLLNAWNEWAEGMYLEPDVENKDLTLKALRDAID